MGQPVVHWEIAAKDKEKAQSFYQSLFDWKIDSNNPMNYGTVETGGEGGINGGIAQMPHDGAGYLAIYMQVDDVQAYLDKAVSLGAQVTMPTMDVPEVGTIALFTDPEGNQIGLYKPLPAA